MPTLHPQTLLKREASGLQLVALMILVCHVSYGIYHRNVVRDRRFFREAEWGHNQVILSYFLRSTWLDPCWPLVDLRVQLFFTVIIVSLSP